MRREPDEQKAAGFAGAIIYACYFTGGAGLIGALISLVIYVNVPAMGLCLVAAALAFGLLANALLRA